jgi:hypothetical protein
VDKIVVADSLAVRANHRHQIIDFVVAQAEIKLGETLTEFPSVDDAITGEIEDLECTLQVQVLQVEGSCEFVQNLGETHLLEEYGLEAWAKGFEVNLMRVSGILSDTA